MSLESLIDTTAQSLIKAGKWIDTQILREYSKLVKVWESKGKSKHSLASIFNATGMLSFWFSGYAFNTTHEIHGLPAAYAPESLQHRSPEWVIWAISYGLASDFVRNLDESIDAKLYPDRNVSDGAVAERSSFLYFRNKLGEVVRLPLLITGLAYAGKGILELADYFQNSNGHSLQHAIIDLSFGYAFFANASSIYVKNNDPKLIEKDSAWKQALDWIKSKAQSIACPAPVLQPVGLRTACSNIPYDTITYNDYASIK